MGRVAPRAVIWDLDGTLIDSSAHHWIAWRETMRDEGAVLTWDEYLSDFGKRNDEILRARIAPDLSDREVARIALAKEERYRALVRERGLALLPGAADWLARLADAGWLQALGTSAPRGNIDAAFAALDIERSFAAVISADDVAAGKPAPDVFLAAAARLAVAPEACVVVEDAPAGVEAARRAGMRSIGVLSTHPDLAADRVVATLDELSFEILGRG